MFTYTWMYDTIDNKNHNEGWLDKWHSNNNFVSWKGDMRMETLKLNRWHATTILYCDTCQRDDLLHLLYLMGVETD